MSDAPERIWACVSKNTKSGVVTLLGDATFPVDGWQEYVRADRIEALEAKLAKTAKVALAYEDWVTDAYDLLEERREEFDPESPSDKAIMDLMDKAEAGIARATLAEIKGESHE